MKKLTLLALLTLTIFSLTYSQAEYTFRPLDLPSEQEELVQYCTKNNPNTVVIVTSGSEIIIGASSSDIRLRKKISLL